MKTILSLLMITALAGVAGFYYWRTSSTEPPKFRTLPVTRGNLLIAVSATGTVEPVEIIDVGAQIVGSVKSFGPDPDRPGKTVDFRSRVKQGEVLAQLDDSPHRAELEKAQAALQLAEAEAKRFCTRRDQAERDHKRAEQLRETISTGEYENVLAEFEIAKADVAMSEAKVAQAKVIAKQAEINLSYTVIRSPVDGVVIDRRVNVGQTMVSGLSAPSLFLLAKDLSHMLVWAAVNEADIGDIHVGQKVSFKVDAYRDRTYAGKVSQIRLNASLLQNVVTYGVVVDVDNTDGTLLPYMTAKLQFEVARHTDVVLVPNQALRWRPTWAQISPTARKGLTAPAAGQPRARTADEQPEGQDEDLEPRVEVDSPTVWVLADDGLVRPVDVQVDLSDGLLTDLTGEPLQPGTDVVVNVVRKAKPDFVSSFINQVTNTKK
ncbi:MAG: efflux RND transporter periplasmic adaptor subunit [Planctomycetota bacterium]|nr:efflux RND transporter periplasmic adaptor subunit [Planctomycetota bacterium]